MMEDSSLQTQTLSDVPEASIATSGVASSAPAHSVATLSSPWQFDEAQDRCFSCASEFGPLNRRHHCRLCGKIFCGTCSHLKALIPPSSIVLVPKGGKKVSAKDDILGEDPDRMLTYLSENNKELLYGKGLEERFTLAREPLRVCRTCHLQLAPLQDELRSTNANAMRFNTIDPSHPRRLLNSPLAFTLGHEIRKAAYTLNNLLPLPKRRLGVLESTMPYRNASEFTTECKDQCATVNLGHVDGVRIPAQLLQHAVGLACITTAKAGLGLAGFEVGTGLVIAKNASGQWSAPSAIWCGGLSWGALIGAQVSDHVFCLMNQQAVDLFFRDSGSVQLGADVAVALGPVGRALEADVSIAVDRMAPIYTYSLSKGLYAGISLDGKIVQTRADVNEKFYGKRVSARDIWGGVDIPTPPAAQPLYEALQRCRVYTNANHEAQPFVASEYGEVPTANRLPAVPDHGSYISDLTSQGQS